MSKRRYYRFGFEYYADWTIEQMYLYSSATRQMLVDLVEDIKSQ